MAEAEDFVPGQVKLTIHDFVLRADALLELLESTADALAATWDAIGEREEFAAGKGFEPTIQ